MTDETWRDHHFLKGALYRVRLNCETATSNFRKGEVLTFVGTGYSRYDSSSSFMFRSATGELKTWFLHDDAKDSSSAIFEPV
jgi:hypothetical protein